MVFRFLKNIFSSLSFDLWKRIQQAIAFTLMALAALVILIFLFLILFFICYHGFSAINWEFLTAMPKEGMTEGGIMPAIVGTFCLIIGAMVFAFPIGVLSGIYMSEYTKDNWYKKLVRIMTNNLAGIPSIVFGLFGMALFVNYFGWHESILSGSLTLGLLALPVIIRVTEESLGGVDQSLKEASLALGATKWQTTRKVVLPIAMPNILTGLILSIGRISGETAPILFTVAAYFLPKLPNGIHDKVMALPYHLYVLATTGTDLVASRKMAYGTALVLVMIVLLVNLLANVLRRWLGKKVKQN